MNKEVNIGIIGLGTVGLGVYKALTEKSEYLKNKLNLDIRIKYVCDIKDELVSEINLDTTRFTKDFNEIINDKDVYIIVELIGGIEPAKTIIINSLKSGKHIITANKALLSEHWLEIYKTAKENNCGVLFEASVAGAIPILTALKNSLVGNKIYSIFGIINGTCNYILTNMSKNNMKFKEALKQAQQKGYAEIDPTFDIEGIDSQHKLTLLILLGFGVFIDKNKILCEGISKVSLEDLSFAKELGFEMKLLGIAKFKDNKIEARVHPTLIDKNSVLASVSNEDNAVFIEGDLINRMTFHGKGAGRFPTASAVIGDIVEISKYLNTDIKINSCLFNNFTEHFELLEIDEIECAYYLHFSVIDKPGVLAGISSVLGENEISISQVIQKQSDSTEYVPIIILTHKSREKNIKKSIKIINKLDFIKKDTIIYRVENI